MAKPSDFYIGVIEFFGILLPGASLAYLLQFYVVKTIPVIWLPVGSAQSWALFVVVAYIAGHLLHGIGSSLLDKKVYNNFYLPHRKKSHVRARNYIKAEDAKGLREDDEATKTLLGRVYLETNVNPNGSSYYNWCLSDMHINVPVGVSEVERLQADSKFFRSMVLVFVILVVPCAVEETYVLLFGTIFLAFFSAWRFCNLRWAATKRVYEYYLLSESKRNLPTRSKPVPYYARMHKKRSVCSGR